VHSRLELGKGQPNKGITYGLLDVMIAIPTLALVRHCGGKGETSERRIGKNERQEAAEAKRTMKRGRWTKWSKVGMEDGLWVIGRE
jgi:hypothetical protein